MDLLPLAAALPALRPRSGVGRPLRFATAISLVAVFLRNLNPVQGAKVAFLANMLASKGIDILPLLELRTVVAKWCWAYQPWLLVPLAFLVAESIRRLPDSDATPPSPLNPDKKPDALLSPVVR
jgi:hypothetical protein